ncbi:SCP2 sterol-binding domain-containing protein [Bacillus rubiinfantis]|uniref:SCP2 sterol-binding domain-containing protein n=1 Tax=Bacillus rubiinfantis TaxID=1499680 RepID=UPI0005A89CD5|nr:SCP2 sterol-binding domain-containing protein [Bacillus rubiinfantis]
MIEKLEEKSLGETMGEIGRLLNENPAPIVEVNLVYQFNITGIDAGPYQLHLQNGQAQVVQESSAPVDCTLEMSLANFRKFLTGSLSGTVAFMTGKLKIKGDITKALKLETILKQYQ